MDFDNFPKTIMLMVVGIIVISAVAVPIITDIQEEASTKTNYNSGERFDLVENNEKVVITISKDSKNVSELKINNTAYHNDGKGTIGPMVIADNFIVSATNYGYGYWFSNAKGGNATTDPCTITIENKQATIDFRGEQKTVPIVGNLLIASQKGDYGVFMPSAENPVFVNTETKVIVVNSAFHTGPTFITTPSLLKSDLTIPRYEKAEGPDYIPKSPTNATGNITIDIDGDIQKVSYVRAPNAEGGQVGLFLIAPIAYTAPGDSTIIDLISIIPILLTIMLLISVVAYIKLRN